MPHITPRQQAFARNYASGLSARQAALKAGYSPAGANAKATTVQPLPQVQDALQQMGHSLLHDAAAFGRAAAALQARLAAQSDPDALCLLARELRLPLAPKQRLGLTPPPPTEHTVAPTFYPQGYGRHPVDSRAFAGTVESTNASPTPS